MAAKKKNAVLRGEDARVAASVALIEKVEHRMVSVLNTLTQRLEVVERAGADFDRVDQKLDRLREVLASGAGVTDQREEFFLGRITALEKYARGEDDPSIEWVERDLGDLALPRGALSVASSYGVNRELVEQNYARYQAAYEGAFRRFREKYPDGVRQAHDRCFACGQHLPQSRPRPLPRLEERA